MTELERELSKELSMQRVEFKRQLKEIGETYKQALQSIKEDYFRRMSEATGLLHKQGRILEQLASASGEINVKLDSEQVRSLEAQLNALNRRLDELERADDDFTMQLNALLQRLN